MATGLEWLQCELRLERYSHSGHSYSILRRYTIRCCSELALQDGDGN